MGVGVGIELGDGVVRAVALERQGKGLRVRAAREQSWAADAPDGLRTALAQLHKQLHVGGAAVIGLPSHLAVVSTVEPLIATRAKLPLAVAFELHQRLPYQLTDAVWDYHAQSNGAPASRAIVAAVRRAAFQDRLAACHHAGVAVQGVSISGLAAANAWWNADGAPSDDAELLINLDGASLEWALRHHGLLHLFSTTLPDPSDPAAAVQASLESMPEAAGAMKIARAWVGGRPAAGAIEALANALGCEVRAADPIERLSLGDAVLPDAAAWLPACGLALQGLGGVPVPVNLLAGIEAEQAARQTRRVARGVSAIAMAAAVAVAGAAMWTVAGRRQRQLANLTAQERLYKSLRPEIRASLQRHVMLQDRLEQLQSLVRGHEQLGQFFIQAVGFLPDDAWVKKIELTSGGTVDGLIEGRAKSFQSVTRLMDQLRSSGGWTTVKPLATAVATDAGSGEEVVAFTIQLQRQTTPSPAAASDASASPDSAASSATTGGAAKPAPRARQPSVRARSSPKKKSADE